VPTRIRRSRLLGIVGYELEPDPQRR
jgi:hypothetical protein